MTVSYALFLGFVWASSAIIGAGSVVLIAYGRWLSAALTGGLSVAAAIYLQSLIVEAM